PKITTSVGRSARPAFAAAAAWSMRVSAGPNGLGSVVSPSGSTCLLLRVDDRRGAAARSRPRAGFGPRAPGPAGIGARREPSSPERESAASGILAARRTPPEHTHHPRRHAALLQGLGPGTAGLVQPRLAAQR